MPDGQIDETMEREQVHTLAEAPTDASERKRERAKARETLRLGPARSPRAESERAAGALTKIEAWHEPLRAVRKAVCRVSALATYASSQCAARESASKSTLRSSRGDLLKGAADSAPQPTTGELSDVQIERV